MPAMAMVMRVVSRHRSTVAPSVQVSAPRWAEWTMQSVKQAICAGGMVSPPHPAGLPSHSAPAGRGPDVKLTPPLVAAALGLTALLAPRPAAAAEPTLSAVAPEVAAEVRAGRPL